MSFFKARQLWDEAEEWSYKTFGPKDKRGPVGPLKHLLKEAQEALDAAGIDPKGEDLKEELADCLLLVTDAARRAGMSFDAFFSEGLKKLKKNKSREWPDWTKADLESAMEHKKEEASL